ncbi:retropepsin-like domain-containing protein [Candidatus Nomurabacteria bacterium]|nr:retropepsin-like domain-containing protein [Candidatus Nomurabacteria bacterium]
MKFNYKRYGPNVIRPVIEVKIKSNSHTIKYHVLVDSGADMSLFHSEVAEALGIDLSKCKKGLITGVGGKSSEYFLHKVSVEVGGWDHDMEIGFLPTIAGRSAPYGIVGQKGFFENFIVKFDLQKEEIELKARH